MLTLSPHPGLPLVREDFFVDDRYVIAMDWIEGADLDALLDIDGHPTWFEDRPGPGAVPVVFLHGGLSNSDDMLGSIGPTIGTSRRIVAFDRRGRPVIVYATFPLHRSAVYWYATFEGGRWVSHRLTNGGGSISPGTIEYEYAGGTIHVELCASQKLNQNGAIASALPCTPRRR